MKDTLSNILYPKDWDEKNVDSNISEIYSCYEIQKDNYYTFTFPKKIRFFKSWKSKGHLYKNRTINIIPFIKFLVRKQKQSTIWSERIITFSFLIGWIYWNYELNISYPSKPDKYLNKYKTKDSHTFKLKHLNSLIVIPFIKIFYNQVQKDKGIIFGWLFWQCNLIFLSKGIDTTEWDEKWERRFKVKKHDKIKLLPISYYFYRRYTFKDTNWKGKSYKCKGFCLSWLKYHIVLDYTKYKKGYKYSKIITEKFY